MNVLQIILPFGDPEFWWTLLILLVIGLIIIAVLGFLLAFPIAALAAILVWFLTGGNWFMTGLTFLIVALVVAAIGRAYRTTGHHGEHVESHEHEHEHEHH